MTNKLLISIVAILIVVAASVIFLAYTYMDIGLNPKSGGGLRVALQSFSVETLDPSSDNKDGLNYHGHLYDHLVGTNSEGRLDTRYGLLSGWQVAPTADAFTLMLEEGAMWHDGEFVTADDILSSSNYYFREGAACGVCGNVKAAIDRIEVVDDRTAKVHLTKPDVVFMGLLAPVEGDMPLLPAHVLDADPSAINREPVGSGPWRFTSRTPAVSVEYEANRDYWNLERVSSFDNLSVSLVPEEAQRIALLETDKIDLTPITLASIDSVRDGGFSVDGPKNVLSTALRYFMSYDEGYLTSSLEFRKALALSIDMEEIVTDIFPGEAATVATGSALFTPISSGYRDDLLAYPYNPDEARALLGQSGYEGEEVKLMSLVAYGMSEMPLINELIVEDWQAIGINAQVVPTEWTAVQPLFRSMPQMFDEFAPAPVLHGAAPARPGGDINGVRRYLSGAEGAMQTYFAPDVADGVLNQLQITADDEDRAIVLQALNRRTYGEYWAIPVLWRHDTYAMKPTLAGWQPTNGTTSDLHFETLRPSR
jgi:ABC-type transport system substrate-binding protein